MQGVVTASNRYMFTVLFVGSSAVSMMILLMAMLIRGDVNRVRRFVGAIRIAELHIIKLCEIRNSLILIKLRVVLVTLETHHVRNRDM